MQKTLICIHHVLECSKPTAVSLGFAHECHSCAAVNAAEDALVCSELTHTVDWAGIEAVRAVRLCLQSYADVLDRTRQSGVGDTGESTSGIIL